MYFSKSQYTAFLGCPKMCWLNKYRPELQVTSSDALSRMERGTEVGDLAKGLFGEYVDMTVRKPDGSLDIPAMLSNTQAAVRGGAESICEAAFSFDGLYCAVDILHREGDGYAIYEVKSSSEVKDYHLSDIAYQKYVLCKCGIKVTGAHIVILNKFYVRHGDIDISGLFRIDGGVDFSSAIDERCKAVEANLKLAERVLASAEEPDIDIGEGCSAWCGYRGYCMRHLPTPSVFDLYRLDKKFERYRDGIISFDDILGSGIKLSEIQKLQIEYSGRSDAHIDKRGIQAFLGTLRYPLYFLDFEYMAEPIPQYDGTCPHEQIPFQYSLHVAAGPKGEIRHEEFLGDSATDPRRALAEKLCRDIPRGVCTLAYSAGTERGIVKRLAAAFPDLSAHLTSIADGIEDLLPVFRKGLFYKREMGGSFSIKSVLPAVFPEMDYHNLEGVQNGTAAMEIYPRIKDMPPEEAREARRQLLEYCERDTLAMVMLWQKLVEVTE